MLLFQNSKFKTWRKEVERVWRQKCSTFLISQTHKKLNLIFNYQTVSSHFQKQLQDITFVKIFPSQFPFHSKWNLEFQTSHNFQKRTLQPMTQVSSLCLQQKSGFQKSNKKNSIVFRKVKSVRTLTNVRKRLSKSKMD